MSDEPNDLLGFMPEGAGEFDAPPPPARIPGSTTTKYRKENFSLEDMCDEAKLITFMNRTKNIPLDAIDDHLVNMSYPAIAWLFRASVVNGDLKRAKTAEMWLNWAKPIISRPPKPKETPPSTGSAAFMAREPSMTTDETEESE